MAREAKLYSVRGLFVDQELGQMLGLPSHVRQAEHYIMATTKAEAIRQLETDGHRGIRPANLNVAGGNTATALFEAGVAEPGDLLILKPLAVGSVVRSRSGATETVGRFEAHPTLPWRQEFVPEADQASAASRVGD